MMLIDCPECGPRNENEFHYGGQAHVAYPADGGASLSDQEWAQYLFFRDNPKGPFAERWLHSAGCRRWFNAVRDTCHLRVPGGLPRRRTSPRTRHSITPERPHDLEQTRLRRPHRPPATVGRDLRRAGARRLRRRQSGLGPAGLRRPASSGTRSCSAVRAESPPPGRRSPPPSSRSKSLSRNRCSPPPRWKRSTDSTPAASTGRAGPRLAGHGDPHTYDAVHHHCEVTIVGAGPAGLAAALTAGKSGERVLLIDERPTAGGALLTRAETDWADSIVTRVGRHAERHRICSAPP